MVRALLALAGAWVIWRIVDENTRSTARRPVALLPKPSPEPVRRRARQRRATAAD
jgi:hypothetical protein